MEHSSLKHKEPRRDNGKLGSVLLEGFGKPLRFSARTPEGPQKPGPPTRTKLTEIPYKSIKAVPSQNSVLIILLPAREPPHSSEEDNRAQSLYNISNAMADTESNITRQAKKQENMTCN